MNIQDFSHGKTFDFHRTFFTVDKVNGQIKIATAELNFFQRVLRTLFHWAGAYKNTFLTTKIVTDFAKQEGVTAESLPKNEALYKQILAVKNIAAQQKTTPPPKYPLAASSAPIKAASHALTVLKDGMQSLIEKHSEYTALLQQLDSDDIATSILSLVAAGESILTAEADSSVEVAKEIASLAQKAVNIAKKESPSEEQKSASAAAATAANKLAADVRIHLKTQNVVIVGKSRSGKTTLMNMVKDVCHVGGEMTIYYGTAKPEMHKSMLNGWNFNTLDTPGWLETVDSTTGKKKRDNAAIYDLITTEVNKNLEGDDQDPFQNVDTFIFTFNILEGIDSKEIACLDEFLKKLPEGKKKILALTRFENALENERAGSIQQLKNHPKMGPLLDAHFKGGANVLLSGCLDKSLFIDRARAKRMEKTVNLQSQALMTALLPEAAKNRKEFLEKYAKANEERVRLFTANEFELHREERFLNPGQYFITQAEKILNDAQKALVGGKLSQDKASEYKKAMANFSDFESEIAALQELVEAEASEATSGEKAKELLAKITAQQERLAKIKAELEAIL